MQAARLDILRYTETVDAVARTSTPNEAAGLGYWFFYGQDRLGPWIESAPNYTQHLWVIMRVTRSRRASRRAFLRWRHRAYFVAAAPGVVIAVGAHPYAHSTPLGAPFKAFASTSTAGIAMRSTGRAAPLVVLALALFLGLGTNVVSEWLRARGRVTLALAAPLVVVGLLLVNFPAVYDGSLYGKNLQRPEDVPSYWTQAIAAASARRSRASSRCPAPTSRPTRVTPSIDHARPHRPSVRRANSSVRHRGSADLLNAMDRRLQEGVADPQPRPLWRRMGIGDVIARNDINGSATTSCRCATARARRACQGWERRRLWAAFAVRDTRYQDEITLAAPANEPGIAPVVVHPVTARSRSSAPNRPTTP
jgi:arabinofuranan 3-O-arabinosyltransferase